MRAEIARDTDSESLKTKLILRKLNENTAYVNLNAFANGML